MPALHALIVAEFSPATEQLVQALHTADYEVDQIPPADLAARLDDYPVPDLILASAALGLQKLALAVLEFAVNDVVPDTVVFLDDDDFALLESCALAGYDYLVPPFLPGLVRNRLISCRESGRLKLASEEMAQAASLHDYQRQLSTAHQIQAGFLPQRLPVLAGWELATRFRPAKEVSGDFYDAFELKNCGRFGLVVADVCDKGVPAALFMALIRTLLRHTAEHTDELPAQPEDGLRAAVDGAVLGARRAGLVLPELPAVAGPLVEAVAGTNRYLTRNHLRQGYFATMFFGVLDPLTGSFLYINGGHNPPVLARANGEQSLLEPTGPAVGMLADSVFALGHEVLGSGDSLFVYSDGVTDAKSIDGEFFGMERLLALVGRPDPADSADDLVASVEASLREHIGSARQYDDITMMAVRNAQTEPG